MTDVGEMYFLPVLMDALTGAAPKVTLQVVSVTHSQLKDDMATGRIDLALGLLPQLQAGFFQQCLFHQAYVCLMRQGHPLAEKNRLALKAAEQKRIQMDTLVEQDLKAVSDFHRKREQKEMDAAGVMLYNLKH
jgi:DNA-binding transcriptional LysR family regulator